MGTTLMLFTTSLLGAVISSIPNYHRRHLNLVFINSCSMLCILHWSMVVI